MNWKTVERWVWYAFVATMAWQTRLILWQADRTFIEWRSASLYLSDILMLALFAFAMFRFFKDKKSLIIFSSLFIFAAISLFKAEQLTVGVYQLLRLAQFIAFYFYLRYWAWHRFDADRSVVAFVVGALVQAGLAIAQYVLQHDVGLRWMGETLLNPTMHGVAVFYDSAHTLVLRAYGTLSHPNVLAAYLVAALAATGWLWLRHGERGHRSWWTCLPAGMVWPAATTVLLWALYLTFSRTIIVAGAVAAALFMLAVFMPRISRRWQNIAVLRRRLWPMLITVAAVSAVFVVLLWPQVHARMALSASDESVQLRIDYARDSLTSGTGSFLHINWFGVGIGNFTTWLTRTQPYLPVYYIQPAHDLFLLVYSEIGILGLFAFLGMLLFVFRACWRAHAQQPALRAQLVLLLAAFCCIALFDHFFWTLQQGRILWWGMLALAAGTFKR